jgi:hypothetical protein
MKGDKQSHKSMAKGTIHITQGGRLCMLENLKAIVSKMEGVSSVQANHVSHALSIEYDPKRVTIDQIRKKIELECGPI